MDGYRSYQQPANTGWLRLLFLSTGFVIGGMCLWAFLQKQTQEQTAPVAAPALSNHTLERPDTNVLQLSADPQPASWPAQSPARAAIQSAKPLPADAQEPSWQISSASAARQASFEVADSQPVSVSKPPLAQSDHYIPLPDFSPLAPAEESSADDRYEPASVPLVVPTGEEPDFPPLRPVLPEQNVPLNRQPPPRPESVMTEAGDSFWNIADRVYGDPQYYAALFEHNRNWIAYPDQIEQGFRVMTPSVEELRERFPELCPPAR